MSAQRERDERLDTTLMHLFELQKHALPSDCSICKGSGSRSPSGEDGPCERCGGWTELKRFRHKRQCEATWETGEDSGCTCNCGFAKY